MAWILELKREMQKVRVGNMGRESEEGLGSKKREGSQVMTKERGRSNLKSEARIRAACASSMA